MPIKKRPENLGPQVRSFQIRAADVDIKTRTARISFSSETPVDMWYGTEILSHAKGAMRIGERQESMPNLYNHNVDDLLGICSDVGIDAKRGIATVRFGKDERGEWALQQSADGILVNTSLWYRVYKYEEDLEEETLTAIDWEPLEISFVTVPADSSVGLGRSAAETLRLFPESRRSMWPELENNVIYLNTHKGVTRMDESVAAPAATPAAAPAAATPVINREQIRAEERQAAVEQARKEERARRSRINEIAGMFNLGQKFVDEHCDSGSSIETVREAALGAVHKMQQDAEGIRARESARISEIEATCAKHSLPAEFKQLHIKDGTSIETFRGAVFQYWEKNGAPAKPLSDAMEIDMSVRELDKFSLRKAIVAALNDDWRDAGLEREVSNELAKRMAASNVPSRSGGGRGTFYMPTRGIPFQVKGAQRSYLGQRAEYQVGTGSTGGNLVETQLLASDFIEVLRNRTVTGQLGAQYLTGLVANINIPRQATQTPTYWVSESGAVTEGEGTFDQVQLRPHVVGALSKMSRLTLQQAQPAIEQLVRNDLLQVTALAVDLAALQGSGSSGQPTGISNTTNVGSVVGGTNGANATFDMLVELYAAPLVGNAPQENLAFAINAKTKGYLATLKASTGQYLWQPMQSIGGSIPDSVVGYRYAVSNQLPYNLTKGSASGIASMAMFGNWQELFIGEWGVTEIAVNPYDSTGFTTGDVLIRVFQTVDIGVRHPASFAVISDMLTPGF